MLGESITVRVDARDINNGGDNMTVAELWGYLFSLNDSTLQVVVFHNDEQFEIKNVSLERADGENEMAVVIEI